MRAILVFLSFGMMFSGISCTSAPPQVNSLGSPPTTVITMTDVKKVKGDIAKYGAPLCIKKYSVLEKGVVYDYIEIVTIPPPVYGEIMGTVGRLIVLADPDDPSVAVIIRGG
ncbi:MAG: hypothetical protein WC761_03615 [Candidatus Paceibacterota bacterium]|jgi:hypothetical protein